MVIAGALAVVAVIAVVVVKVVLPGGNSSTTGFVPTGSTPGQDAQQLTTAFLQAWQAGNLEQAAKYTSQPAAAHAALVTYGKYLHLRKLTATAQGATAAGSTGTGTSTAPRESVTYAASATVSAPYGAKTLSGTWSYHSSLVAYQQPDSPAWYIAWKPGVLAPHLTATTHLATVSVAPQVALRHRRQRERPHHVRRRGPDDDRRADAAAGKAGQGSPGLYVEIQNAKGNAVANSQAIVVPCRPTSRR